tara:strand:+ start:247 stop:684 length:438 start_codon:yes stop_codon:yes gene_type:complete
MRKVEIYTDGCCKGNPGPGGYGCILKYNGRVEEITGASPNTTNNIMEMTAAIAALEALKEPCQVKLFSDSQYLVKGMTEWIDSWVRRNWVNSSNEPVKNQNLWKLLLEMSRIHDITWRWIKGHAGHPDNERCDQLANQAMSRLSI